MYHQPKILIDLIHLCELIALIAGIINFKSLVGTFWKWFVIYLGYITMIELFRKSLSNYISIDIIWSFLAMPVEFLFFIWLFALKSLNNKKLFIICCAIYLLSFIQDLSLEKGKYYFSSFNYLIGGILLLFLVLLELLQQIKSDDILRFKQNKMFYITFGVGLFYVGNIPFFGLYYLILKEPQIWNYYYIFFAITNCLMYLLFAASFIWGKPKY